jgi:NTE family protein
MINTLLLSGGGVNGVVYCGIMKRLSELDLSINRVVGVSIGSVIGFLYIIGYDWDEIIEDVKSRDFKTLTDIKFNNLFKYYGLDSGNKIREWIIELMAKKNISKNTTLIELFKTTNIFFQILTSNLSTFELFSFDYQTTPNIKIIDALRLAISVPLMFTCVKYNNSIYVDAAIINNCPVDFISDIDRDNMLVINLITNNVPHTTNTFIDYIKQVFSCYLRHKTKSTNSKYIININVGDSLGGLDFDTTIDQKINLINLGYNIQLPFDPFLN